MGELKTIESRFIVRNSFETDADFQKEIKETKAFLKEKYQMAEISERDYLLGTQIIVYEASEKEK